MRRFFADLVNIIIGSDSMIFTSSDAIEFKHNLRAVKNTVRLFREAVEYLIAQGNIGSIYDFAGGKLLRQEKEEKKR